MEVMLKAKIKVYILFKNITSRKREKHAVKIICGVGEGPGIGEKAR